MSQGQLSTNTQARLFWQSFLDKPAKPKRAKKQKRAKKKISSPKSVALSLLLKEDGLKAQLARELGMSQGAISKWIARGKIPSQQVQKVSRIIGIPTDKLHS